MKKQLFAAAASVALMALPTLASADDAGWYVRGNVGYGVMTDMNLKGDLKGDVEGEGNGAGSLGLGYEFGNNWRMELDATQLWNDLGAISQLPGTTADMRTSTMMLNAIYDFSDFGSWEPYVGAGIGLARTSLSAQAHDFASGPFGAGTGAVNVNNPACTASSNCTFDRKDTGVAWQLLAGLGYKISDNLTWDTQYRYQNVGDLNFSGLNSTGGALATTVSGAGSHSLLTGLRYRFGAKSPRVEDTTPMPIKETVSYVTCTDGSQALSLADCPKAIAPTTYMCSDNVTTVTDINNCPKRIVTTPAAPTISCPDGTMVYDIVSCPVIQRPKSICDSGATDFVVYFPWDKSYLTDQAKAVVLNATNMANQCGITDVIIEGHADSSGAPSYNMALSSRRANSVENELRRDGITTSNIVKSAKGETALAVPTGDGVR